MLVCIGSREELFVLAYVLAHLGKIRSSHLRQALITVNRRFPRLHGSIWNSTVKNWLQYGALQQSHQNMVATWRQTCHIGTKLDETFGRAGSPSDVGLIVACGILVNI